MGVNRKENLILYKNFLDSLINGSTQEKNRKKNLTHPLISII